MDHDRFFKELLTTFFVEFVKLFLPDVARYMDPNSIEFLDKEIFTDIASSESHEVDLIVKVRFRHGGQAFFLIHVESQASSRKDFARRMFRYFARLHEKYNQMLKTVEPKEREVVMQLTNEWIEQGRQEGRQEGRGLVLRLLRRRLGAVPVKLARQVDRLDDAEIIALGDAVLDFTSPADAQRWLARHAKGK
jgi:hypothetical protein